MMRLFLAIAATLLMSSSFAAPEISGTPEELREFLGAKNKTVTISAEASELSYTDKAIVSLVVTTENKKLANAIDANSKLRHSIRKTLTMSGIRGKHINSSRFSTSPQFGLLSKVPNSYKVVNRMAIGIFDETQLKEIATVADTHPQIQVSDTVFEHTEKELFRNRVKESALYKVLEQKKFYEKNLGVRLSPVSFKDTQVHDTPTQGATVLESVVNKKRSASGESYVKSKGIGRPSFDEIKYHATVSVEFDVE